MENDDGVIYSKINSSLLIISWVRCWNEIMQCNEMLGMFQVENRDLFI